MLSNATSTASDQPRSSERNRLAPAHAQNHFMQLPDEAITYQYQGVLQPATEEWTAAAELRRRHFLAPARLRELAPRLTQVRGQVAAERELKQVPPELQPLDAGFIDLPQNTLDQHRKQVDASPLGRVLALADRLREDADRIVILNASTPGALQIRRVECVEPIQSSCYTDPARFVWEEYRLAGTNLEFIQIPGGVCATPTILADNVTALTFRFTDESPCQPFGAAGPQDNNVIAYELTWNDGTLQQEFVGQMTSRLISCSSLPQTVLNPDGTGDSGIGLLSPPGISNPPGACP